MKQIFETLFLAVSFAFVSWLVINAGVRFEVIIKGQKYGFSLWGLNDSQRKELFVLTKMNKTKDNILYQVGLTERTDSAFLVESFFPSLDRAFYDSIYVFKLIPKSIYTVTGGIYLIVYSGVNFTPHETIFRYDDTLTDSVFRRKISEVRLGD